jgi:hypothetical protein
MAEHRIGADAGAVLLPDAFVEVYDNNKRAARDPAYQITVNASLQDATGRTVREVSERRSSQAKPGASGGHGFTMLLPLTSVPGRQDAKIHGDITSCITPSPSKPSSVNSELERE